MALPARFTQHLSCLGVKMSDVKVPFDIADVTVYYSLSVSLDSAWDEPLYGVAEPWHVDVRVDVEVAEDLFESRNAAELSVVRFNLFEADQARVDVWEVADAWSADWESFVSTALRDITLEDEFSGFGSDVLLVEHVWLAPEFRGFGLAPLLVAEAVRILGRDCVAAFIFPEPTEGDLDEDERIRAAEKLAALWSQVGFEPWRNGYMALDLASQRRVDALEALRDRFRRYPSHPGDTASP